MLNSQDFPTAAKQLYHMQLEGGRCDIAPPDSRLAKYIDYYWFLTVSANSLNLDVIPDTAMDLVLCPEVDNFAALYFPVTEKFSILLEGPIQYAGVCFKSAEVTDVFGLELRQLRQLSNGKETADALGIQLLSTRIQAIDSMCECRGIFDEFWLSFISSTQPARGVGPRFDYRKVLSALEETVGESCIQDICQSMGISERQFRRCSNELFGFSPKKMQNVIRLQATLTELLAGAPHQVNDLFFDDSHRIRELKRLTGLTPREIRQMAEKYNS
ncbi:MAG: DUF6597 domain-containing transcriptional factor [Granulosicoccus sp.]